MSDEGMNEAREILLRIYPARAATAAAVREIAEAIAKARRETAAKTYADCIDAADTVRDCDIADAIRARARKAESDNLFRMMIEADNARQELGPDARYVIPAPRAASIPARVEEFPNWPGKDHGIPRPVSEAVMRDYFKGKAQGS